MDNTQLIERLTALDRKIAEAMGRCVSIKSKCDHIPAMNERMRRDAVTLIGYGAEFTEAVLIDISDELSEIVAEIK